MVVYGLKSHMWLSIVRNPNMSNNANDTYEKKPLVKIDNMVGRV